MSAQGMVSHFDGRVLGCHFQARVDARGALTPFEFTALPFTPVRAFVVSGAPGASRGGHAHVRGQQLLVCLSGEVEVEAAFEGAAISLMLDAQANAVLIRSPVWSRQIYRGEGAQLLVFSDVPFDPESYID
ncbi:MAG: FdtA/QdtA family cupin domain-containing protein [Hyphomonadaceae bacterium]|nr:FdtA/QdtA family cupin domain-containing protein [Hyphomonadaceae bacterium]